MQVGIERQPALHVRDARRDDEAHGVNLQAERLGEREARLPQGEVERGRLERPAPVLGLPGLQERERLERVAAGERELVTALLEELLLGGVVVDLLAAALLAAAAQHDDGAAEREAARDLLLERLQVVAVDDERQRADGVVGGHRREPTCVT